MPRGTSVLNAARSLGIHVSTLCDHPTLESVGACRMCVVEIQPGPPRPAASCTTPASQGMQVRTDTKAIVDIRRKTIEMLLQHHPLDCPYCDQSGTCELQDETFDLNIWKSPFETVSKGYPEENLNEVVMINHNRCILCYRCVRVCDEQMGVHALDVSDRGGRSFIVTAQHKFMDCERCGMCIEVCPVGAVLSRPFKHVARAWQTVQADSTCPHCSVGCKIQVESRKGEVLRVRVGEPVEPNRGIVCVKGFFGWSFINDDERIARPMIRRAGELVEVGWSETIEFVSDRLTAIAEMEGPETIGAVGSGRCTNEDNYSLQRLMRSVVGTNNVYLGPNGFAATHQVIGSTLGSEAVFHSQDELLESDVVLVIGADINGTHNVLAAHLKAAARQRGPRLIVATRIGSALDVFAHQSVRVRPGAESKLLTAISGEDIADPETSVGVSREDIAAIREAFGSAGKSAIVWDTGLWTSGRVADIAGAACNVALSTGKTRLFPLPEKGNLAGAVQIGMDPAALPGPVPIDDAAARARLGEFWGAMPPAEPGIALDELLYGGKMKALYVMGEDIVGTAKDPAAAKAALEAASLVIVQDIFMNSTASVADVVLPGTTFAEKSGHFINFEGRACPVTKSNPTFAESREDWEIPARIAARMGADFGYRHASELWNEINEVAKPAKLSGSMTALSVNGTVPPPGGDYPFALVTETNLYTAGSSARHGQVLADLYPAQAEINETDAENLAIADGETVEVRSASGAVTAFAKLSRFVPAGVVYLADSLPEVPARELGRSAPDATPVCLRKVEA